MFKLLGFSTVYLILTLNYGLANLKSPSEKENQATTATIKEQSDLDNTKGFCYEIYASSQLIGYTLELKNLKDKIHSTTTFTQVFAGKNTPKTSPTFAIQQAESNEYFTPLKSTYEINTGDKLKFLRTSYFEETNDKIKITTNTNKDKKSIKTETERGLVLSSQMFELLFQQKKISDIKPKEKLTFETYSESEGKIQQVSSSIEDQSDLLTLNHISEGETFETKHSINHELLSSKFKTKNYKITSCSSTSVLTHLNSALSNKKFKSLFSNADREKIRSCCQLF